MPIRNSTLQKIKILSSFLVIITIQAYRKQILRMKEPMKYFLILKEDFQLIEATR